MSSKFCRACSDPVQPLDTIPVISCRNAILQAQRAFFAKDGQIIEDTADPLNNVPAALSGLTMEELAFWAALVAASDDSKVVTAPLFGGDTGIEAGTAITFGGGSNETLNGVVENRGVNPNTFTGRYDNLDKDQIHAIRKLACEGRLSVVLVNEQNKMLVWEGRDATGASTGLRTLIPVTNFFLGPKANTGFASKDANILTFQIPADYDEHLVFITPEAGFNPLTFNA